MTHAEHVTRDRPPAAPDRFTFAVYPTAALNPDASSPPPFEPFLLDVPGFALEPAARRAYFSAMAYANRHGVDVDGFHVCIWNADNTPGQPVGPGGVDVPALPGTCRTCGRPCGSLTPPRPCCQQG